MHGTWQRHYGYSRSMSAAWSRWYLGEFSMLRTASSHVFRLHVESMDGGSEGLGGRRAADGEVLEKVH